MPTIIHFINVGQGNMVLIETSDGKNFVFDCNITNDNQDEVLNYVATQIGWYEPIYAFICSHRDADHMRGVKKLHAHFPIQKVWDSDHRGTTTNSPEYLNYMDLRRKVGFEIRKSKTRHDFGRSRFRYLSAQDERLPKNANAQGIIIKVEHRSVDGSETYASAMLTGDSDAECWRYAVMEDYDKSEVKSSILMAGHHGSITFFDDPKDTKHYYENHTRAINPDMTIISVGSNSHGHPASKAIELYTKHSKGSDSGNKVFRTDKQGNMKLTLKDAGGWNLKKNQ